MREIAPEEDQPSALKPPQVACQEESMVPCRASAFFKPERPFIAFSIETETGLARSRKLCARKFNICVTNVLAIATYIA